MSTNYTTQHTNKCPNCGAPVNYKQGMLSVYCEYCKSGIVMKTDREPEKKSSNEGQVIDVSLKDGSYISCPNCSAEYLKEENTSVDNCIFCNAVITSDHLIEGSYVEPTHYLPFQVDERQLKKNLGVWLKEQKLNWFKKIANLEINKIYIPCLADEVNFFTSDKELLNTYFAYRTIFTSATEYISNSNMHCLHPWNRNQLIPKDEDDLKKGKLLLYAMPSRISENASIHLKHQAEKYISRSKWESGEIKRLNMVLLPVHEFRFTYKGRKYTVYGNGYNGKLTFRGDPILPHTFQQKLVTIIEVLFVIFVIVLFLLAIMNSL